MRQILILFLILSSSVLARPLKYEVTPGQAFGPLRLAQPLDASLTLLKGWTYSVDSDYAIGPYYVFPKEDKTSLVQFILGFDEHKKLRDVEIHDASCHLKGHPDVRLGCTRADVEKAFGKNDNEGGDSLEYHKLGIVFWFESGQPPRATPPYRYLKFKKGQCSSMRIFLPKQKN